jgi:alpha-L-arabinofuranosidase
VADRAITRFHNGEVLTGPDPKAANSYEKPNFISSQALNAVDIHDGVATVTLPPLSVAALSLALT